jgi:hypothetical protein
MEKIEIQKQQVIGWVVLTREGVDDLWNIVKPIVSLVGRDGDDLFWEKHFDFDGHVNGMLPAAPGTYRVTTNHGHYFEILGVSHPGDGISDEYWLVLAKKVLKKRALIERRVRSRLQIK